MARRSVTDVNILLAIDKPAGCTSHDVVARVRRSLGERRVGHAGTLDPMATGVMVVGVGQGTRLLGRLTLDTKAYLADIAFGAETNTDDAEGEATRTVELDERLLDAAFAAQAVEALVGPQQQVPPAFSAISVGGVRSYKRARAGEDVELPARAIEVLSAQLIDCRALDSGTCVWTVAFTVSKGTYIRALARDLGRSLNSAAHLVGLRRLASGSIALKDCVTLDELDPDVARARALDPVAALGLPALAITDDTEEHVLCGRRLSPALITHRVDLRVPGARFCLLAHNELRAIAQFDGRAIRMEDVFPQPVGGVRQ